MNNRLFVEPVVFAVSDCKFKCFTVQSSYMWVQICERKERGDISAYKRTEYFFGKENFRGISI